MDNEQKDPERYELYEKSRYHFELDRRQFLKIFGGGIVLMVPISHLQAQQGESGRRNFGEEIPQTIGAWIHIDEDGSIKVFTGKVEMGQNIRTSLTQAVADELHAPVSSITLIMGDTDLTPFDMGTFGSRTTPTMAPQLRKAAAAAREALISIAAQKWNVDRKSVRIVNGQFVSNDGKSFSLADLAKGQTISATIPDGIVTTPPAQWTVAGTSTPKVSGREFVTGTHKYTSDLKRPDMLYAKVIRPSTFGGTIASIDTAAAQSISGVVVVRDENFIGIAAPNPEIASEAARQIKVEWKTEPQPSNAELFELLKKPGTNTGGQFGRREPMTQGSIDVGLQSADKKLDQTYTVQYIAHAPLEPRAAVAEWNSDKLTVWTGTQRPFGVRTELAEAFRIPEEKIRVIVPDTGSAYGGKHTGECAIEAARIARTARKPVKLVWTREEEFTWAYFRPAGVIQVRSGVTNDGSITAWEFHNYNSGPAGMQIRYNPPNHHIEFHPADSPLRQGSYRALAATANHFARETHIDELAHAVDMDPLEFRLKNTNDDRLKGVLQAVAQAFGWNKKKPDAGRAFGIACGFEKDDYVATCAEISFALANDKPDNVRVVRIVEAFDCGAVVNPNHLKNQIEGAIMMGIGGALFEHIRFENGKILNARFSRYRVPRFADLPLIEVVLVDRKDIPSAGAGETPIVGVAPAIGNAIFSGTGVRIRSLPLFASGV